ncbi:MAG: gas vesicle accessory protein GvpU [Coleofasciculus sp. B1-GNL1-01]|uniref:gas vesicle accessory protein GvpU n=1 Tax=Coleofasciculus sp. B1-GNL1-01 TaxID=3068484 RepID=UPI003304D8EB
MTESPYREFEKTEVTSLSVDLMLETFVSLAEEQDFSLGVTLTVHGLLISGHIISFQKYLEGIAQSFESATGNQKIGQIIAESYRNASQEYSEIRRAQGIEELPTRRYIHLSDARFRFGDSVVSPGTGVYWRGRLDEVDGFFLGIIES